MFGIYFFMIISIYDWFCGHSMRVIPGLVSIPEVKSFCVLFVYYGFLWEFHFAASLLYIHYYFYFVFILFVYFLYYFFFLLLLNLELT